MHQIWHFYCFSGSENIPMDGNLFDKKRNSMLFTGRKLLRSCLENEHLAGIENMSTRCLQKSSRQNMLVVIICALVQFFCKDTSLWYFLLLWFTTSTYIAMCLSVRDKIDRTAATWMSGCFLRKETLQTHERYWQKLAFVCLCLSGTTMHNNYEPLQPTNWTGLKYVCA